MPRAHDGTIIPAGPHQRWGAGATMAWTYNNERLIQRHGHCTPREKDLASLSVEAA
jgi:hypothetical protein